MISRRRFLIRSLQATAAGSLPTGLYTWQVEPHWLELVNHRLPIRGLSRNLVGARLVQLSDLHVGEQVADTYILETFQRVAALKPDIVAFTGDFVSYHRDIYEQAARIYAQAPRGRLATLGILGNHEYGRKWAHPEVAERLTSIFETAGVQILRNAATEIEGLQIIGLDDLWAGQFRLVPAWSGIDHNRAVLVLSHNPDTADLAGWPHAFSGWILAGHTHGGQCKPPFLPPPLVPVLNRRYTAGKFDLPGGRTMYVNRGVGHLIQVRFNVRPEVTVFELVTA